MPNRSLEAWLSPRLEDQHCSRPLLTLCQRLDISIDVAGALDYLHHDCQTPPIVHCDLKPSNILLDDDMIARVGDFGLAKLLYKAMNKSSQDSFSLTGVRGSIGYVAPEYGAGRQITTAGDVYSYGILLLEMFTGKKPVDDAFKDGLTLCNFVEMAFPERIMEIIDPLISMGDDDEANREGSITRRTHECLLSPGERMSLQDAAADLHAVRDVYNNGGIRRIHEDSRERS